MSRVQGTSYRVQGNMLIINIIITLLFTCNVLFYLVTYN